MNETLEAQTIYIDPEEIGNRDPLQRKPNLLLGWIKEEKAAAYLS